MKRMLALLLSLLLLLSFTGCKSKAERELEQAIETANQLDRAYRDAVQRTEELKRDLAAYEAAVERYQSLKP